MTETDLSHLVEGALDAVGQGHSGWTHVFVSLNKIINRSMQNMNIYQNKSNQLTPHLDLNIVLLYLYDLKLLEACYLCFCSRYDMFC